MSIKHLQLLKKEDYSDILLKNGSVSIEYTMRIDDCSEVSPFVQMIAIDDFRGLNPKEIEDKIMKDSKHIAQTFYMALHNRKDCLNVGGN